MARRLDYNLYNIYHRNICIYDAPELGESVFPRVDVKKKIGNGLKVTKLARVSGFILVLQVISSGGIVGMVE